MRFLCVIARDPARVCSQLSGRESSCLCQPESEIKRNHAEVVIRPYLGMDRMEIRCTALFSAGETSMPPLVGHALHALEIGCVKSVTVLLEAFICFLRYSTQNFDPKLSSFGIFNGLCNESKSENGGVFNWRIASLLTRLVEKTVSTKVRYSTLSDYGV